MNRKQFLEAHHRGILAVLLLLAFALRVALRMALGEPYFWEGSYSAYYELAQNVAAGKGFCSGTTCAWWPPLYPAFLALTVFAGKHYLLIVVPQAILGAATAFCAWWIGRRVFSPFTGLAACAGTALYPYYVMHDTALQETGMVKFWTILSVCLLLRAADRQRRSDWLLAGVAIGLIALTRASIVPFAAVAMAWTAIWGTRGPLHERLRIASLVAAACVSLVAPWLIRTWRVTGAAVLSSQTGRALWIGNHALTFSAYPSQSIDVSTAHEYAALSPAENAELAQLEGREIQQSDWFRHKALAFVRDHPAQSLWGAIRKVGAGFWWRLNPLRGGAAQFTYAIGYVPVALLGIAGMWRERRRPAVILILLMFLAFIAVSAVFWAHTSHRTYLDVYWIVLAASLVDRPRGASLSGCRRASARRPG